MRRASMLMLVLLLLTTVAREARADGELSGWAYMSWPYVYSSDGQAWSYIDTGSDQWVYQYGTSQWLKLGNSQLSSGWVFFALPYAYSVANGAWSYLNESDVLWLYNYVTGHWVSKAAAALSSPDFRFEGEYPSLTGITFTDKFSRTYTVTAYAGQVQLFASSTGTPGVITNLVKANGGTIIGQYPSLGYYLVSVTPAQEATFISAVGGDPNVAYAMPNFPASPAQSSSNVTDITKSTELSPVLFFSDSTSPEVKIYVVDDFAAPIVAGTTITHGSAVKYVLSEGVFDVAEINAQSENGLITDHEITFQINKALAETASGNVPTVINISIHSGLPGEDTHARVETRELQLLGIAATLDHLSKTNPTQFANTFIFQSAGNEGLDLASVVDNLRTVFPSDVLDHLVIVGGANENLTAQDHTMNYSINPGDIIYGPSTILVPGPNGSLYQVSGTSFATPFVAYEFAQYLKNNPTKSPSEVMKQFREAAKAAGDIVVPIVLPPPPGFPNAPMGKYMMTGQVCDMAGCRAFSAATFIIIDINQFAQLVNSSMESAAAQFQAMCNYPYCSCSSDVSFAPFDGTSFAASLTFGITCCGPTGECAHGWAGVTLTYTKQ